MFRVCQSHNSVTGQLDPKSGGNTLLRIVGNYFALTRLDMPDDLNLHQCRCVNLKSYAINYNCA